MITPKQTPTMVQRDYERIIREIGTPASIPKPRGKSPGRREGVNGKRREDRPLVRKTVKKEETPKKRKYTKKAGPKASYRRMERLWEKARRFKGVKSDDFGSLSPTGGDGPSQGSLKRCRAGPLPEGGSGGCRGLALAN